MPENDTLTPDHCKTSSLLFTRSCQACTAGVCKTMCKMGVSDLLPRAKYSLTALGGNVRAS